MFNHFIGIDQTGASQVNGRAKPLPCTMISCKKGKQKILYTNYYLSSFTQSDIKQLYPEVDLSKTFILIDTVLGVPKSGTTHEKIRNLFRKASQYRYADNEFGALVAHNFFMQHVLIQKNKEIPKRVVEQIAKANSIFLLKPFQRNIGCGTFRIWKDLGGSSKWYSIWPFESRVKNTTLLAEGYPSYIWKNWIGAKRGDEKMLRKFIDTLGYKVEFRVGKSFLTIDHMDSCVLSLYAAEMHKKNLSVILSNDAKTKEGWIFGVKADVYEKAY